MWQSYIDNVDQSLKKRKDELINYPFEGEVKTVNGNIYYFENNKLHRENDLPAIIHSNGTKEWYVNGERHRNNNLPAIESFDGEKQWYVHDKCYSPFEYIST
jgi:hypothetical protein